MGREAPDEQGSDCADVSDPTAVAGSGSGTGNDDSPAAGHDAERLPDTAFRTIVETSDDGIVTFDDELRVRYADPTIERVLDTTADGLRGRTPADIAEAGPLDSDTATEVADAVEIALDRDPDDPPVERTIEFTTEEGFRRAAELQGTALPDDADAGTVVVAVRDVTDRTEVERKLRESRRKIEQLHEAATDIVAARTEKEAAERAVRAAEEILEFDVCSLTLKRGEWFVPVAVSSESPEDGVRRYREDEGLLGKTHRTGESQRSDDVHADSDTEPADDAYRSGISVPIGDLGVFQATSTEVGWFDEDDVELAETLMAHVAETIRRINTEAELREREADLVTERDRFAALFENVPDPVVAFDFREGEPIVTDVNGPFEAVFGYDGDEIVGENVDDYILPPDHEEEAVELNRAIQSGRRLRTATKRKTADGVRDFLLHVVPVEIGEENLQGFAIYTDITEQKERQRELERQNERLDEFASIVSHDLRNPLSVAEGYLELTAEDGDEEYFERVEAAHDRMRRMIDELLALAREGELDGTDEVAIATAAEQAQESIDDDRVAVEISAERVVEADFERLVELFENLFRNAIEHGRPDENRGSSESDWQSEETRNECDEENETTAAEGVLTVRVGDTDDGFFIADDGVGFEADDPNTVFESGYTTAADGTGFGLAIVQRIVRAHDWSIDARESDVGGARFDVTIR